MFNRKKVKYRRDMYTWKTKRKSNCPREDHVKLKVEGIPCITALYVHSDIMPTFHRRCYWFIQNPDIILVHYLNFPYIEDGKNVVRDFSLNHQCQQWQDLAKEDIIEQLKPMFANMRWPRIDAHPLTPEQGELIINRLVDRHFAGYTNQNAELIAGRSRLRTIKPKTQNSEDSSIGLPSSNPSITTTTPIFHFVNNNCIPNNGTSIGHAIQLNSSVSTAGNNRTVLVLSDASITQCRLVKADAATSTKTSAPENSFTDNVLSTVLDTESSIADQGQSDLTDRNRVENDGPIFSLLDNETAGNPNTTFDMTNNSRYANSVADYENTQPKDVLIGGSPTEHVHPVCDITSPSCLEELQSCQTSHQANIGCAEEQSQAKLTDVLNDFGVKDPMVANCRDLHSISETPLFGENLDGCNFNNPLPLDMFDVESLFNVSPSTVGTPVDSSDQANSSTESAISDLFPHHLWEHNLEETGPSEPSNPCENTPNPSQQEQTATANNLDVITDYSPDWSYTEGGIKILIAGRWSRSGDYRCVFDDVEVPAVNLQIGVLRCFCPAHKPGHVTLCVKCDGDVISETVQFEYKSVPNRYTRPSSDWLQLNEKEFKMSILERLERMEAHLNSIGSGPKNEDRGPSRQLQYGLRSLNFSDIRGGHNEEESAPISSEEPRSSSCSSDADHNFEERLIGLCKKINSVFNSSQRRQLVEARRREGLTVLHYSAALGYSKLVNAVRSMRLESDNEFVKTECDPQNLDKFDCTPLMWASACGQISCAESLCLWSSGELGSLDVLGRSPLVVARQRGHTTLCDRLQTLAGRHEVGFPSDQEEVYDDDADISSIGDTTVSGTLDTLDSGEDSMETDDSFLCEAPPDGRNHHMPLQLLAATPSATQPTNGQPGVNTLSWQQDDMLTEENPFGNGECVTSLAEQIVEYAPDYVKASTSSSCPLGSETDLTLRNLPRFVNSHCYYSPNNTQESQGHDPGSSLLNWGEFLQLPPRDLSSRSACQNSFELQLDSLRLTEHEQRQLYNAATTVLNAFHCEGIALNSEVLRASLLIKGCYKKYKKFAVSKKMNEAAVLIQSKFRSYQEQKRFQRSRHAAILIQSFYRSYKYTRNGDPGPARSSKHTVKLIEDALRGHMTKKRQHQAARKIQRFLRQCQYRLRHQDLADEARTLSSCMKGFYAC